MLKNILNLNGVQQLSKNEQKAIGGGQYHCTLPPGNVCDYTINAQDCFSLYEGVYNTKCKCCIKG
ncbi:MAG: hypothetical protein V4666_00095 [Bacteroidota bacterium]